MSARRGRPRLAEGEGRSVVFTLRLTELEHADIELAARLSGEPVSRWAREALLQEAHFIKYRTDITPSRRQSGRSRKPA